MRYLPLFLVAILPLTQSFPAGRGNLGNAEDPDGKPQLHQALAMLRRHIVRMRRFGKLP